MSASKTMRWNERLRHERIRRNWRQNDLAEQLGSTVLTIQRWERGSHEPSAYFRVKLCMLFDLSAEAFGFVPNDVLPASPSEQTRGGISVETSGVLQEETPVLDGSGDPSLRSIEGDLEHTPLAS